MLAKNHHSFMRSDSFGKLWGISDIHRSHLSHHTCHVSHRKSWWISDIHRPHLSHHTCHVSHRKSWWISDIHRLHLSHYTCHVSHNYQQELCLFISRAAGTETIHSECSKFTVTDFQLDRTGFQTNILNSLRTKLAQNFYTDVRDVQVRSLAIDLWFNPV